jgi:peptide/nickel transport system permease protein
MTIQTDNTSASATSPASLSSAESTPIEALSVVPVQQTQRFATLPRVIARWTGLVLALLMLALILLWAVAPSWFTSEDPLLGVGADRLLPPSADHFFGTDQFGRDVYTRVVYGAWLSVSGVVIAVVLSLVVGTFLGLIAGFVGGWLDDVIMRLGDVMLAIPAILLSMAVITALGGGTLEVAIAVGIASIASIARTMRSEVLRVRTAGYVDAARAGGVRWYSILARHVLPNSRGPVIVLSTVEFGTALLAIAALSFLGYGATPPTPEWGAMISEGRDFLATAWWLTTIPGLLVVLIVLSVNQIAREVGTSRRFG